MTDSFATINRFSGFASVFAFLCIIPIPNQSSASLHSAARNMHLFPIIGAILGCGVGLFAWGLFEIIEPLLAGLLISVVLLVITGFHHTDGVADMADALMVHGTHKRKLDAMKDHTTGTAGITAVMLSIAGLIITLSLFTNGMHIFFGVIVAEVLAKFSMVLMATIGKPATCNGTGVLFANAMSSDRRKIIVSAIITIIIIMIICGMELWLTCAIIFAVAVLIPVILAHVAKRNFGGITGDVIGATNDIVRVAVLAVFVSV